MIKLKAQPAIIITYSVFNPLQQISSQIIFIYTYMYSIPTYRSLSNFRGQNIFAGIFAGHLMCEK